MPDMPDMPDKPTIAGLAGAERESLDRVAIRTRESGVTLSAWRLSFRSAEGRGAIVRVDASAPACLRGEGVCLGWPQARLAELYEALSPTEDAGADFQQLG